MTLDLLPNNATRLERDLAASSDPLPRVGEVLERIRNGKRVNIPDSVVDWLIYEYGLGEVTPYLTDPRQALAQGLQWQRVRGTPRALQLGLGWINFPATVEESEADTLRWSEYQLGLEDGPADHSQIGQVVGISGISQPARSRMFRIHGGWYDFRRFKLNDHALSEGGILCDHSGVIVRDDWPQLSFGREYEFGALPLPAETTPGVVDVYAPSRNVQSFPADTFRLSINFLSDDDWHTINHPGVAGRLFSFTSEQGVLGDYTILPELQFAKAQVTLSDSWGVLGDTNSCLPARVQVESGELIRLSDQLLSETPLELVWEEINERFDVLHAKASEAPDDFAVTGDFEHNRAYHQFLEDTFVLGRSILGDPAPLQLQSLSSATTHMASATYGQRRWSAEPWPTVSWDAPPLNTTPADLEPYEFCLAGMYLSEHGTLGDTNGCLPSKYVEEQGDQILHLSEDRLSETVLKLVDVEVLERFDRLQTGGAVNPYAPTITSDHQTDSAYAITLGDAFVLGRDRLSEKLGPITQQDLPQIEALRTIAPVRPPYVFTPSDLDPYQFSKAQIVLSDSTPLGDTNAVLPVHDGITERFDRSHAVGATYQQVPTITSDHQTDTAHHVSLVDTFILGRDFLSEALAPVVLEPGTRTANRTSGMADPHDVLRASRDVLRTSSIEPSSVVNGSIQTRYTLASVYTAPQSQTGAIAPNFTGAASYPDSGQTWTTASWPPTSWADTQVIVGSAHATT